MLWCSDQAAVVGSHYLERGGIGTVLAPADLCDARGRVDFAAGVGDVVDFPRAVEAWRTGTPLAWAAPNTRGGWFGWFCSPRHCPACDAPPATRRANASATMLWALACRVATAVLLAAAGVVRPTDAIVEPVVPQPEEPPGGPAPNVTARPLGLCPVCKRTPGGLAP